MSVFSLKMLKENGHLIALYDPKMGRLSNLFGRGMGITPPENLNVKWNKI